MLPPVIGLIGKAGSGKDSFAKNLPDYDVFKFASPVKEMIIVLLGCYGYSTLEAFKLVNDPEQKEKLIPELGVSGRYLMQSLGTEWGRNMVKTTIWTDILHYELPKYTGLICTDVRFQEEADIIKNNNGVLIKIIRPNTDTGEHSSETELDRIVPDYVFHNDFPTIEDFNQAVLNFMKETFHE